LDCSTGEVLVEEQAAPAPSPVGPTTERPSAATYTPRCWYWGRGPGGYSAAFRAADLGKSVVLVDSSPTLGGVCLNIGCIPSKALLHAARVIAETREMAEHGLAFGEPSVDLDKLREWKEGSYAASPTAWPACQAAQGQGGHRPGQPSPRPTTSRSPPTTGRGPWSGSSRPSSPAARSR
jgi:hypothetical protein